MFVDIPAPKMHETRIRGGILTDNNRFRASICTTTEASTTATTTDMLNFLKLQNSTIFFANLLKIKGTSNVNRRVVRGGTISVWKNNFIFAIINFTATTQTAAQITVNVSNTMAVVSEGSIIQLFGSNVIGLNGWYRIQEMHSAYISINLRHDFLNLICTSCQSTEFHGTKTLLISGISEIRRIFRENRNI